jgi:hypothetical protein
MKIQDLSPPVAVPEPAWKQQLVEFWQQANDHCKLDLEVTLKMGDAQGARRVIESWHQEVAERRKKKTSRTPKKKKPRVRYGYGGYWYPGTAYAGQDQAAGTEGGGESIQESADHDAAIQQFFSEIVADLEIQRPPKMLLQHNSAWSQQNGTFGSFDPANNTLELAVTGRHLMDIVRTMAHELVHCRQNEIDQLPGDAGETGSPWEDEANAVAGRILRGVAARHPDLFKHDVVESSGYIPTEKEKNDPRFVMALSPDVRPGATGKNANRMALKTDAQGRPQVARANGLVESLAREFALLEDEFLGEIKMTGKNLRAEAAKTGARAGMEFEMIVPNTETDVEPEYEPDMDQDQTSRSFSDVRDFFHDGDYNGRRQVDNLIEELIGEYEEWQQEQTDMAWAREGIDFIRDFVENNDLFDRDQALDQARDEVVDANPDLPPESEDFQQLINARINELQEQFVMEAFEDQGRIYNDAFETFADEQREEYDERSFLDDRYQTMSDIQSNFDISWPYYYDINDGQSGDMDGQQVADEFGSYMNKPVNYSSSYHGGRREPGTYVVEPDGSLEGDNPGDGGLEFVSPPMPIDEMVSDLNKVKAWADKTGCYTNDSTGLHINIERDDYSINKLDYVKLAILMGDEYILDLFGRSGNTYAKSAMGKIKSALKQKPEAAAQIMDLMKQGLDGAATKAIHTGITNKYTSINTKTGYIEFRSPGGDWLDSNFANIENTLLRFTVALSAAINPEAYRKEYLTKLYKLLSEGMDKSDTDVIQLFSNYSAGELDKAALIRQVRQKQLARNVEKGKTTGKMWWNVSRPGYMGSIEVVASSKEEAIDVALQPSNYPNWASARSTLQAKPLRPYMEPPAQTDDGKWGIWISDANKFTVGDGVIRRWASQDDAELWLKLRRESQPNTRADLEVREIPADYQQPGRVETDQQPTYYVHNGSYNTSSFRAPSRDAAIDHFRRNWNQTGTFQLRSDTDEVIYNPAQAREYEVFDRDTDATVYRFTAADYDAATRGGFEDYITMGPHGLTPQQAAQRYGLRRAGPRYFIHDRGANRFIHQFFAPTLDTAERELTQWETRSPGANLGLVRPADLEAYPALAALAAEYSNRSQTQEPSSDRDDLAPSGPGNTQGSNTGNWGVWTPRRERFVTVGASTRRFNTEADAEAWIQDYNTREPHNDLELTARRLQSPSAALSAPQSWYVSVIGQPDTEIEIQSAADSNDATRQAQIARPGVFAAETGNIRAARVPVGQITGAALPDLFPEIPRAPAAAQRSEYELYRRADGRSVIAPAGNPIVFQADSPDDAANKIARYVADFNLPGDPTNYDVRSVPQPGQSDAAQGGIVDVAGEQPTTSQAPQEWTGEWLVLDPNGRELHRFSGIGNVQADANRHAINWLRAHPGAMQAGITVVPEMA